jgi:hypothetical protein
MVLMRADKKDYLRADQWAVSTDLLMVLLWAVKWVGWMDGGSVGEWVVRKAALTVIWMVALSAVEMADDLAVALDNDSVEKMAAVLAIH